MHDSILTLALVKDANNLYYLVSLEDESLDRLKRINLKKQIDAMSEGTSQYNIVIDELCQDREYLLDTIEKAPICEFKEEFIDDYNALIEFVKQNIKD
jgi:hypothetical protein